MDWFWVVRLATGIAGVCFLVFMIWRHRDIFGTRWRFTEGGVVEDTEPLAEPSVQAGAALRKFWGGHAIEVLLPRGYPIAIAISWIEPLKRKHPPPLGLGDPRFDHEFDVRIAPADVVRALIDQNLRGVMLQIPGSSLTTERVDDRTVLRLTSPQRFGRTFADTMLRHMSTMPGRVRELYANLAPPPSPAGAPFRPDLDDTAAREVDAERIREVEALLQSRAERTRRKRILRLAVGLAASVACIGYTVIFLLD